MVTPSFVLLLILPDHYIKSCRKRRHKTSRPIYPWHLFAALSSRNRVAQQPHMPPATSPSSPPPLIAVGRGTAVRRGGPDCSATGDTTPTGINASSDNLRLPYHGVAPGLGGRRRYTHNNKSAAIAATISSWPRSELGGSRGPPPFQRLGRDIIFESARASDDGGISAPSVRGTRFNKPTRPPHHPRLFLWIGTY